MKYFELDKNEKKILNDFEIGKLRSIKGVKREVLRYRQYARQTLAKVKNINIRLSRADLQKIRALAAGKGLPYQTLISSLLHQYSIGQIKETAR
jgi:predicted DNA binding CopG/RHH family protein